MVTLKYINHHLVPHIDMASRFEPALQHCKDVVHLCRILGLTMIALQFVQHSQNICLAFRVDREDWPSVAEHATHMHAVAVPLSSASITASCGRGLSYFDAFVCAKGTIVVDNMANLVTVFAPKPNNEGRITRETIGKLTDEKVHSWLDIGDEFATDDSCTLEKTAASYFPHILFLAASPSPKGLKFIIETGKGKRATLTGKQLEALMKIWYRWEGRYSAEHEAEDDSRSSGDTFVVDAMGDEKGT